MVNFEYNKSHVMILTLNVISNKGKVVSVKNVSTSFTKLTLPIGEHLILKIW
jgi:hypothetical protein